MNDALMLNYLQAEQHFYDLAWKHVDRYLYNRNVFNHS